MTDPTNYPRLIEIVDAMQEVINENPAAHEVDMMSPEEPECGAPGCHAGLLFLAMRKIGVVMDFSFMGYDYDEVGEYFSQEIGFADRYDLVSLADSDSYWWGSSDGGRMFCKGGAFKQPVDNFNSQIIVDWWRDLIQRNYLSKQA